MSSLRKFVFKHLVYNNDFERIFTYLHCCYYYYYYFFFAFQVNERDPWSKLICHRCAFKLDEFYNFRELCVRTDAYLKTQVSWEQPGISQHIPAEPVR